MFEGLKRKFSDFVDGLSKKEKKEEEQVQAEVAGGKKGEKSAETKPHEEKNNAQQKGPDVTLTTKIKGALLVKVKISDRDAEPFLEQLRVALLETDVNYDVAERLVTKLHDNLVGKEVGTQNIQKEVKNEIRNSLMQTLTKNSGVDILQRATEKKQKAEGPFKILFLGPNGIRSVYFSPIPK